MPAAPGSIVRVLSSRKRTIRPFALVALAAPLALGACVAENDMKSSALAPRHQQPATTPTGGPDAYGYAPVRLAALGDGARIALPSTRPDLAKLQAAAPAAPAAAATVAPAKPETELAALKADVEERRAALVVLGEGKGERVAVASLKPTEAETVVPAPKPTVMATARNIIDPRKSVPAAISAVAHSADAVKVAAIDTTTRAFDAVQTRIGDTFKGDDTVTGSASMDRMIEEAAADNGIPTELAYAVVRVESHYRPDVIGGGAYGLSQIKPATARGLGYDGPAKGLFDPQTNLRYGMKYLAGAWEKSGHDICGTAMRYKGGHRTTVMSRSAAAYCANVKRHMAAIKRSRVPASTLVASAEPRKQTPAVLAAAAKPIHRAPRAATVPAAPGGIALALGQTAPSPKITTVADAVPVPTAKGGRVRVFADGEATANSRYGYAEQ
ncbi:lytic transglycosylase domain-containing protein [Aureimonas psammosilenae]|uniref:lytic transglycosylase domain-containing protein n=1 Tax=Aureimonas psammosilenae TaxID=2495496 RepID=UPI0012612E2A|nr:transglycosylase SLT domain-containing protein [Aureimonas psammosilenae]